MEDKTATVTNCYNTGEVSGAYVGGVAGVTRADDGCRTEISNCFNIGKISGTDAVGGVAGLNYAYKFIEAVSTTTVTNCYNIGAVSANADYAVIQRLRYRRGRRGRRK